MIQLDFWRRTETYCTWIPSNFYPHARVLFLKYLHVICSLSLINQWLVPCTSQVGQIPKS